ncbi:hypothetical protein [Pseudomonas sp. MWU13-2517]|uniref:hypothetical protein n=1 Tax=Pseudomonas sp. MWU13-2517 TaxID=2929055 RepID=UPI00200CB047|nr:hypothetical protein [Pseudomonas sp. MWU13-2517]
MTNFDAAAGISVTELNTLLGEYYKNAPSTNDPFKGSLPKTLPNLGAVTLTWDVGAAPSLIFGPPTLDIWNAALAPNGKANGAQSIPLPSLPMVQLTLPTLTASYTLGSAPSVGGTAPSVVVYATLTFNPGTLALDLVAVSLDESRFSTWDKAIFNLMLLPQIFASANQALAIVHLPSLDWKGVTLNPIQLQLTTSYLLGATTLTSNTSALDIEGVTWPTDDVFVIASNTLLNTAMATFLQPYQGHPFSDSGDFKKLADWSYSGSISSLSATVKQVAPLTINAQLSASLNAKATLTAAGMALAAAGCAIGAALL